MKIHSNPTYNFHFALLSFLFNAKQNLVSVATDLGLTGPQAFALLLIDTHMPRSMKTYSSAYACDAANITGIIDGLEAKKLVKREQDPNDRRVKTIHVLPAGLKLREQLMKRVAGVNDELLAPLSKSERSDFEHCIHKLAK